MKKASLASLVIFSSLFGTVVANAATESAVLVNHVQTLQVNNKIIFPKVTLHTNQGGYVGYVEIMRDTSYIIHTPVDPKIADGVVSFKLPNTPKLVEASIPSKCIDSINNLSAGGQVELKGQPYTKDNNTYDVVIWCLKKGG